MNGAKGKMQAILKFIMMYAVTNDRQVKEKIRASAANFLINTPNAALITNDGTYWHDMQFPFPLTVRRLDSDAADSLSIAAFIIDLRVNRWDTKQFNTKNRSNASKYVFITTPDVRPRVEEALKELGFCHALILTVKPDGLEKSTNTDACRGIGHEKATLTGCGCTANVSFLDLPPNVIFHGDELNGFEGLMAQTACDHMGIRLNYVNRHETGYGQFRPPSGLQGDAGSGSSLLSFGALYAFHYRYQNAETIFGCHNVPLSWAVPMGAGATHPTWFVILISEFSKAVWVISLAMSLTFFVLSKLFTREQNYDHGRGILHLFGLILGTPSRLIYNKWFTMIVLFFGFMIGSYYRSIMSSKLTVPAETPEIETLQELADSGLILTGPPTVGDIMNESAVASSMDSPLRTLMHRYEKTLEGLDVMLPSIAKRRDAALLRHGDNLYYNAQRIPEANGFIHMVEESVFVFKAVTLMPKHSCLAPRFQTIYNRLCASGLGAKWKDDLTTRQKPARDKGPRKLAMEHITGFLYLLIFGWAVSAVAFIMELGKISQKCSTKRGFMKKMYAKSRTKKDFSVELTREAFSAITGRIYPQGDIKRPSQYVQPPQPSQQLDEK